MQVTVLLESLPGRGIRATAGFPFNVTTEGQTRDEVLQQLRSLIDAKLTVGREILHLDIPIPDNPWLRNSGTLDPEDPLVQEWLQIMEENRRQADNDPDFL